MSHESSLQSDADAYLESEKPKAKADAYDNLLWRICTASSEELQRFAPQLWNKPYSALPVPLLVTTWRLAGPEYPYDLDAMSKAVGGIALHANPSQEKNAAAGIRRLLAEHDRDRA